MDSAGFRTRLTWLLIVLLALMGLSGFFALQRLRGVAASVNTVYLDRIVPVQQLRLVHDNYRLRIAAAVAKARDGSQSAAESLKAMDEAQRNIRRDWSAYRKTYLVDEEIRLIAETDPLMRRADEEIQHWRGLLAAGDLAALKAVSAPAILAVLEPVAAQLDRLIAVQLAVARAEAGSSQLAYSQALWTIVALILMGATAGGALAWGGFARYRQESEQSEARGERLQRFYQALSQTNQLIVRERSEDVLFREICRICVHTGHAGMSSIGLLEGAHLRRVASAGVQLDPAVGSPTGWDLNAPDMQDSLTVRAWREGRHTVSQDYQQDPAMHRWRERAVELDIHAAAIFPFYRHGQMAGMLALYAHETDFFDEPLIALLDEMVRDLAFALDNIDREAARQEAMRQSVADLERFRLLFHRAPVSTIIISMGSQRILDVNRTSAARYGLTPEQMIGHTMAELSVGLLPESRQALYERLQHDGRVENMEVVVRVADGVLRHGLLNGELIDYQGERCLLAMNLDITERRQAEQARTEQLAAEADNRAKTEFLSRMSHELRTPLTAVLGFSQLLLADARGHLAPLELDQLEHIQRAGWHLLHLINDVLDVSRIEAGHLHISAEGVALRPLVFDAITMSEALAREHRVSVHASVDDSPEGAAPAALADPVRLRQVLLNLLSNAIKYNQPGGRVHVSVVRQEAQVLIEVVDTGVGMSAEQMAHLYEPFNRLGREGGAVEGTGIGLALTRQLVRLMQGDLQIESRAGHGTRARLSLPSWTFAPGTEPGELDALGPAPDAPPAGVVLCIEDNPVNMLLVEQMLSRWPAVTLLQAVDGRQGLARARSHRPDLVLLDLQLPDISGMEVLDMLRGDETTARLPIVALSASAMPDEVETALRRGASAYWTKPLDFETFLAGVARLLRSAPP